MAISFISQTAIAGTSITTMPTHAAGDLLLMFAFRNGSTTAPTAPAGWTVIDSGTGGGGSSCSSTLAYKVAASSSETSGTWTNGTHLALHVYRGQRISAPIGGFSINNAASGTSVSWAAVTLTVADGSSWLVPFVGHRSNLSNSAAATTANGGTRRSVINITNGSAVGYDSNGGVSSAGTDSATITATSSNYTARAVEIIAQPATRVFVVT